MILTDAGPLIALMDRGDHHHGSCVGLTKKLPSSVMVTTWPCLTEAMYLLGKVGGHRYQARLWELHRRGTLRLIELTATDVERVVELMANYADQPMDLADASLVTIAERLRLQQVFTLDAPFRTYRLSDGMVLQIIP